MAVETEGVKAVGDAFASDSATDQVLHLEARATAGHVRHDGATSVDFRDGADVDRKRDLDERTFLQAEVYGLDEHTIGAEVAGSADLAPPGAGNLNVDGGLRAMSRVQSPLHSAPSRLPVSKTDGGV